jgi:hypothetical protein
MDEPPAGKTRSGICDCSYRAWIGDRDRWTGPGRFWQGPRSQGDCPVRGSTGLVTTNPWRGHPTIRPPRPRLHQSAGCPPEATKMDQASAHWRCGSDCGPRWIARGHRLRYKDVWRHPFRPGSGATAVARAPGPGERGPLLGVKPRRGLEGGTMGPVVRDPVLNRQPQRATGRLPGADTGRRSGGSDT